MKKIALLVVAFAIIVSCKKDDETSEKGKVNISFEHKVGSETLDFDTIQYTSEFGHDYEVRTLKYFLSNIIFTKSDGSEKIVNGPIYINADDPSTLSYSENVELPSGTYESISVTFGIDSTMNITDTLTTVEESAMAWPETNGGGYHYMKLEGTYDSLGNNAINNNFNIHTGATMGNPYDFNVLFENSAFTIDEDGIAVVITMDISEWFKNPNNYDFAEYGSMIMMNMDAQMELKANGPSVLSISVN